MKIHKKKKQNKKATKYLDMEQVKGLQQCVDNALDCLMDIHYAFDKILVKEKKTHEN